MIFHSSLIFKSEILKQKNPLMYAEKTQGSDNRSKTKSWSDIKKQKMQQPIIHVVFSRFYFTVDKRVIRYW